MKDTIIYNRTEALKNNLNDFFYSITKEKVDYFTNLTNQDLIKLKSALSDVNNVLTLKATIAFTSWMVDFFKLPEEVGERLIEKVNKIKPNTNGFDIEFPEGKIIAEIKCIIPINGGNYFGSAQKIAILNDAIKLYKGNRTIKDTSEYYKIIGLVDLGERTDIAFKDLLTEVKNMSTKDLKTLERHDMIKKIFLLDDNLMNLEDLTTEYIFIKPIAI